MDVRLQSLYHQWKATPSLANLELLLTHARRIDKVPDKFELGDLFFPAIQCIVNDAVDNFNQETNTQFPQPRILVDTMVLIHRTFTYVGPKYDICVSERGGVSVGSTFVAITLNPAERLYLIENPRCIYDVPQRLIDLINVFIMDDFDAIGWFRRNDLNDLEPRTLDPSP